jgi:hypothetical protein
MSAAILRFAPPLHARLGMPNGDFHALALARRWTNEARQHVDIYSHPPVTVQNRRERRAGFVRGWEAFVRACEWLRVFELTPDRLMWRAVERQIHATGVREGLDTVYRRLRWEQNALGREVDVPRLPADLVSAFAVDPANLTAPPPARPRRTKRGA